MNRSFHVFKDNCFTVKVQSRSSIDTYFELDYDDHSYALLRDSYQSGVLEGRNTYARITNEYDALIRDATASMFGISRIEAGFRQHSENTSYRMYSSPDGLDIKTLVLDGAYDAAKMGNRYGYIVAEFLDSDENIHIRRALEILTEIDRILSEEGVGYCVMEITVVSETHPDSTRKFFIYGVTKEDLSCEDPLARLQEKWDAQEAERQARKD